MKKRTSNLLLILLFNVVFGVCAFGQTDFQYQTKIMNGEEVAVKFKPINNDGNTRNIYPPIWDNPAGGGSTMGIVLKYECNPRVNNVPLEADDFIGGFYTDDYGELKCGGAAPWPGNLGVVLSLTGDNNQTPEKDGFDYQEQITFRVFSWERMKEYDVDVIVFDPDSFTTDKWVPLGLSEVIDLQALVDFDFYISASENPLCIGSDVNLQANEFVGSNGNYTYTWTSDPPGFNFNVPNPPPVIPDESTTYFLTVSDGSNVSDHFLTVNVNLEPEVVVGEDATICVNEIFTATAQATNYTSILWSTSGDGYFLNENAPETSYYPGQGDKANGQVNLTFTAQPLSPCQQEATDVIELTIYQYPSVDAGNDIPGCNGEESVPVTAIGVDYETITWETAGDGTFENPNTASTLYYPGTLDFTIGEVNLTVCVTATAPCFGNDCDGVKIEFVDGPSCNAPPQISRCEDQYIPCVGVAFNNSGVLWTTQGDGTFDDSTIMNAKYYGGVMDRQNGGTIITLNALPFPPCTEPATKDVIINFYPLPRLTTFGENTDFMCPNDNYLQLNADLDHYTTFSWSTNGDGYFSGSGTLSPKYYPGTQDFLNKAFELELTGSPVSPCTASDTFTLNTTIFAEPEATILTQNGSSWCGEVTLTAQLDNAIGLNWTTGGDGYFDDPEMLNPIYYPGPQDLLLMGSVTLTLEAYSPCAGLGPDEDQVQLFFQDNVSVDAGINAEICATDNFPLTEATAANYNSINWTTNGDGTFSNTGALNPVYSPGSGDIQSGQVQLTITGYSIAPCTMVDTDQLELSIMQSPQANAGTDATICETETHQVQNASAEYFESFTWETSGDGSFTNIGIINPEYIPGPGDVASGSVLLTLNVAGISPCGFIVSDDMILSIQQGPVAIAGSDAIICESDNYLIADALAENFSTINWQTSGDGIFSDPTSQNPVYSPGASDINTGNVVLTFNAEGILPCDIVASDQLEITFQKEPGVDAGGDATTCGQTSLSGSASNQAFTIWTTAGDGTFEDESALSTTYYPGPNDLDNLAVVIQLTAYPIAPCLTEQTDNITITINLPTVIDDQVVDQEVVAAGFLFMDFIVANPELGEFTWIKDGELLPEQSSGSLFLTDITPEDVGVYQCLFTNSCGLIASNEAMVEVLEPFTQTITLEAGWQGISSFVESEENDVPLLFQPVEDEMVILSDNIGFYWPSESVNTLGSWFNTTGYRLKMEEDATLMIEGAIRYPKQSLIIMPGWTYLPVSSPCPVDVEELFGTNPGITLIKDMAGTAVYIPEFGINNLLTLEPGKAYQIFNESGIPIEIDLPDCE